MPFSWGQWLFRRKGTRELDVAGDSRKQHRSCPASTEASETPVSARTRTFGVPLIVLHQRDGSALPRFLKVSYEWLNANGIKREGLWRIPGNVKTVRRYKTEWDRGTVPSLTDETSPFDVCSAIKLFFKELPGHLVPNSMRRSLVDAAYIEDPSAMVKSMRVVLRALPRENFTCLEAVIHHFYLVDANKATTRMTAKSLAMCFFPRLAHAIEVLVLHYGELFAASPKARTGRREESSSPKEETTRAPDLAPTTAEVPDSGGVERRQGTIEWL